MITHETGSPGNGIGCLSLVIHGVVHTCQRAGVHQVTILDTEVGIGCTLQLESRIGAQRNGGPFTSLNHQNITSIETIPIGRCCHLAIFSTRLERTIT